MDFKELATHIVGISENIIFISDIETEEIMYVNKSAQNALYSIGETEWIGKKSYQLMHGTDKLNKMCEFSSLKNEKINKWEEYNEKFNKRFVIKAELLEYKGRTCRIEIAFDITKSTDLEQELGKKFEENQILEQCMELLHSNLSPSDSLNNLLKIFGQYYNAERAGIFIAKTSDATIFTNTYEWCNVNISNSIKTDIPASFFNNLSFKSKELSVLEIQCKLKEILPNFQIIDDRINSSVLTSNIEDENGNFIGLIFVYNPSIHTKRNYALNASSTFIADFLAKNQMIQKLNNLSYHDVLTNCKNNTSYRKKIKKYEYQKPDTLGVAYVDINGLKSINNTKGHIIGDNIIIKVSEILTDFFGDSVYRIDGNEFIVLKENICESDFEIAVNNFKTTIKTQNDIDVTIGFSWNTNIKNKILRNNLKLNEDKVYENYLRENLAREIKDGRFTVFYQPQIDMQSKEVFGAEALIRKFDTSGNLLAPYAFVPFYEKQEIISLIDFFVIEEVCKYLSRIDDKHLEMSVNFSRVTFFEENIVEKVLNICNKYSVLPKQITIEVTETIQGFDQDVLVSVIKSFLDANFSVSLDDFGSGYSNMVLISATNFNEIKIDKSLVDEIVFNDKSLVLTELIISACELFGNTKTVAEGIESFEQYEVLRKINCNIGQGYYFDKPLEESSFTEKYV